MQNITCSNFRKTISNYSDHIHLDNENYVWCTTWYFFFNFAVNNRLYIKIKIYSQFFYNSKINFLHLLIIYVTQLSTAFMYKECHSNISSMSRIDSQPVNYN